MGLNLEGFTYKRLCWSVKRVENVKALSPEAPQRKEGWKKRKTERKKGGFVNSFLETLKYSEKIL